MVELIIVIDYVNPKRVSLYLWLSFSPYEKTATMKFLTILSKSSWCKNTKSCILRNTTTCWVLVWSCFHFSLEEELDRSHMQNCRRDLMNVYSSTYEKYTSLVIKTKNASYLSWQSPCLFTIKNLGNFVIIFVSSLQ